jgi:hypothetical protein
MKKKLLGISNELFITYSDMNDAGQDDIVLSPMSFS